MYLIILLVVNNKKYIIIFSCIKKIKLYDKLKSIFITFIMQLIFVVEIHKPICLINRHEI